MKTEVTPQWPGKNLGTRAIEHAEFSAEDYESLNDEQRAFVLRLIDKQAFITAAGRYAQAVIKRLLPARDESITQEAWMENNQEKAAKLWQTLEFPTSTLELVKWAHKNARASADPLSKAKALAGKMSDAEKAELLKLLMA